MPAIPTVGGVTYFWAGLAAYFDCGAFWGKTSNT